MKTFRLTYTMTCDLDLGEIWPDEDAPSNPTAADVEAVIKRSGGWVAVLKDWDLGLHNGEGRVEEVKP